MNYLPLIERELQVALRRRYGPYKVRLFCAVIVMVAGFWILFIWTAWHPTPTYGRPFLQFVGALGYCGSLLAGVALTADSISREKREGTLDLLLLTDLRIGDVIVGKLLANTILPLCGFIAMVPALEVSVLVGGTTAAQCGRLVLVWCNALLFALASSVLVSALSYEQRTATAGSILAMLTATAGLPFLGSVLSASQGNPWWASSSLLLSPTGPYQFADRYETAKPWFWTALIVNQILAWTFVRLAQRRLTRTRLAPSPDSNAFTQSQALTSEALSERQQHPRPAAIGGRPIQWLASRRPGTSLLLWCWSAAALGVALGLELNPFGNVPARAGFGLLAAMHLVFKLSVATSATHAFAADRRSGALESLLATAIEVREIASGMLWDFKRRLLGPVLLLAAATGLAAVRLVHAGEMQGAACLVVAVLLLPLDSYCLLWVGLFQGLAGRTPALALATAMFEIVVLPWAWFLICAQIFWRSSFPELLLLWSLLTPANHFWFLTNAKSHLLRHFRTLALKPFGERNPLIESDWSPIDWASAEEPGLQR